MDNTNMNPVNLTDEERDAIAELEAEEASAGIPEDDPDAKGEVSGDPRKDRAWLDEDRDRFKSTLTDAELAALSGEDDEAGDDETEAPADAAPVEQQNVTQTPPSDPSDPSDRREAAPDLTEDEVRAIRDETLKALAAATTDYEDGELTGEELAAKQREILDGERGRIEDAVNAKIEQRDQEAHEARRQAFHDEAGKFFRDNPILASAAHLEAFDNFNMLVQRDPRNASLSPRQLLDKAKDLYAADAATRNEYIPGVSKAGPRPKHATREAPPTLGRVPAAAVNEPEGSRLAAIAREIDSADSERAEQIMASLTASERDAILSGAV